MHSVLPEVHHPLCDPAGAPPYLGDVSEIEVVLIMIWIAQWRGLGVNSLFLVADIGGTQNAQPFGVGGHDSVLDSVVDHLDKMAGAVWTTVQIPLFGGAFRLLPSPPAWHVTPSPPPPPHNP